MGRVPSIRGILWSCACGGGRPLGSWNTSQNSTNNLWSWEPGCGLGGFPTAKKSWSGSPHVWPLTTLLMSCPIMNESSWTFSPLKQYEVPLRVNFIQRFEKSHKMGPNVCSQWAPSTASHPPSGKRKKSVVIRSPWIVRLMFTHLPSLESFSPFATTTSKFALPLMTNPAFRATMGSKKLCVLLEYTRITKGCGLTVPRTRMVWWAIAPAISWSEISRVGSRH